jgi:uncharacterized membrane protein
MSHGNFDAVIFSATLTPHRSLGRAGFLALMTAFGAAGAACGAFFFALGGWPVAPFLGLDLLALGLAFRLSYRAARAQEQVEVRRDMVVVRKISPRGKAREFRFNPAWTRLIAERDAEQGVARILLASRGASLAIGGFLNPDDRTSFARAFGAALAEARR